MFFSKSRLALLVSAAGLATALAISPLSSQPIPSREPIAYIGHGAFFDREGKEIAPTPEFIALAQAWYRQALAPRLTVEDQRALPVLEKRLMMGVKEKSIDALAVQQQVLNWMIPRLPMDKALVRVPGKLRLLDRRLTQLVGERLDPALLERFKALDFKPKPGGVVFLATNKKGQPYLDECDAAGVPIPPPINRMFNPATPAVKGWTSQGFIPRSQQFIVGTPAEVRTFVDSSGVCVALPRYYDTDGNPATDETATAQLDGVICLSKINGNTCFWDNSNSANPGGFDIPAGTIVPIGVPTVAGGLYQAGGAELEFAGGGVCTDCHSGENPYIVHPEADLGGGLLFGDLDWKSPQRYTPFVGPSWPQNLQSHSFATVPAECKSCHTQAGAGRLPHLYLSEDPQQSPGDTIFDRDGLTGYCNTVLRQAVGNNAAQAGIFAAPATMPQFNEGTMTSTVGADPRNAASYPLVIFRAFCGQPRSAGPSDRGDPHLVTTDGTSYDFQAAGEFTALKNSDTGFELQTRQTPVTTTFTPDPNPYTGLASCVSLNTAVAARMGKRRVTYQSPFGATALAGAPPRMQLRIDGVATALPAAGIDFGGGDRIDPLASGDGIRLSGADGTRVAVTPNFWSNQGYWYLDVEVGNTPAREGTMGTILPGNWLPLAPNGASFGMMPAALGDRHVLLNQKFADAWRVRPRRSLFDYAAGTSSGTFTDRSWPSAPGGTCTGTTAQTGGAPPVRGGMLKLEAAQRYCRRLTDPRAQRECAFDITVMGEKAVLGGYVRSLQARSAI
jgi:hypothetical protein